MIKYLHRAIPILLGVAVSLSLLVGCSSAPPASTVTSESSVPQQSQSSAKQEQTPQDSEASASKSGASTSTDIAPKSEGSVLIAYFSATGNTKAVAEVIATATEGELYEIVPEVPYTSGDLNGTDPASRSSKEHNDPSIRPAIADGAKDLSGYDTIFIGYPIWWGEAPNIIWNFVESSDLSGKTIIPFATSPSGGLGSSGETLKDFAPDGNWLTGERFRSGVSEADVQKWVSGLNI